jgi:hypothetical protein
MDFIKKVSIIFFLASFNLICICQETQSRVAIKSVHCNVSSKYIYENLTCNTKFSKQLSTTMLNIRATAKAPIRNFYVSWIRVFDLLMTDTNRSFSDSTTPSVRFNGRSSARHGFSGASLWMPTFKKG